MRGCGDVALAHLGPPKGHEAGHTRPVVLVTAQPVLDQRPSVVHVVPLTATLRGHVSEVVLHPDRANGLEVMSAAQCQHLRAIAVERLADPLGNVGPAALARIREVLADLLDL